MPNGFSFRTGLRPASAARPYFLLLPVHAAVRQLLLRAGLRNRGAGLLIPITGQALDRRLGRCPWRRRSGFLSFGPEAHESENSGRCRWNGHPSRPERLSICMPHFSGLIRPTGSEAPDQNALVMVISTLEPTILTLTSSARLATMDFSSSSQSSLAPSRLSMLFSSSFL